MSEQLDDILKIAQRPLLNEIAYDRIKALILNGNMRRGDPLVIDELARKLGTSRTPVREAVLLLAREGLAVSVPNHGTFVAGVDKEEIMEIYEVRGVLEPLAVRLATPVMSEDELTRIMRWAESIRDQIDKEEIRSEYSKLDVEFHNLAVRFCGNKTLQKNLTQLTDKLYRIRIYADGLPLPHLRASLEEHSEIMKAMLERNPDIASQRMAVHMKRASRRMAQFLTPEGEPILHEG